MATRREGLSIAKKQLAQREALWPNAAPLLWNRHANPGFATIPKTMPLILQLMDGLSNGKPVSSTYFGLWCETWDNAMVNASKHEQMAHAAGFAGQRAVYTWQARIKILEKLGFIDVKPGKSGEISHILILNPHTVLKSHHSAKTPGLVEAYYNALLDRALDIGALDMLAPTITAPASSPPASANPFPAWPSPIQTAPLTPLSAAAVSPAAPLPAESATKIGVEETATTK